MPEDHLRPYLPRTDMSTLRPCRVVLCFQPNLGKRHPIEMFMLSSPTRDRDTRTAGWWLGFLERVDEEGWAIVQDVDEENGKWDCDGDEFPIYDAEHLPEPIRTIFDRVDHLKAFLESRPSQTLEQEFFSRA